MLMVLSSRHIWRTHRNRMATLRIVKVYTKAWYVPVCECVCVPSHPLTLSPSHSLTLSLSHPLTLSPSHPLTLSPSHSLTPLTPLTRSPSHPLTLSPLSRSPSHPLTLSPSHALTLSPSHPLTLSPCVCVCMLSVCLSVSQHNATGKYHCFLNAVIQSLWHVQSFRERFESLAYVHNHAPRAKDEMPCLFCSLRDIFASVSHLC
jgi:Ubiquitin carboxyl-terminal hydrolase